jgi:hypothetical protein
MSCSFAVSDPNCFLVVAAILGGFSNISKEPNQAWIPNFAPWFDCLGKLESKQRLQDIYACACFPFSFGLFPIEFSSYH